MITVRLVPGTARHTGRHPDVLGAGALLLTLSALSVTLIVGREATTRTVTLLASLTAVVAAACFVRVEHRSRDPLLPLGLFRRRRFLGGNLVWLLQPGWPAGARSGVPTSRRRTPLRFGRRQE